jgi:hypothetical protein
MGAETRVGHVFAWTFCYFCQSSRKTDVSTTCSDLSLYQNPWKSGSRVFSFVVTEGETEMVVLLDAVQDANALEARLDCVEIAPQLK